MIAQALSILAETGHPDPRHEEAGRAFVATLLAAGWDTKAVADAIQASFAAAGPHLSARSAYTLMAYEATGAQAIVTFRRTFLESLRPGISKRSEEKPRHRLANQPGEMSNNVFSNSMSGFWGSLLLEPADDEHSRDAQLQQDMQNAVKTARTASSQARRRAKQQQAKSLAPTVGKPVFGTSTEPPPTTCRPSATGAGTGPTKPPAAARNTPTASGHSTRTSPSRTAGIGLTGQPNTAAEAPTS